jgi:hypothetical protein
LGPRHCEERGDAAIQEPGLDCFATLAMTKWSLFLLAILLAACRDQRPPEPSAQQSAQLNETEDMLNDLAANEDGPADQGPHQSSTLMGTRSAGPSNQVE